MPETPTEHRILLVGASQGFRDALARHLPQSKGYRYFYATDLGTGELLAGSLPVQSVIIDLTRGMVAERLTVDVSDWGPQEGPRPCCLAVRRADVPMSVRLVGFNANTCPEPFYDLLAHWIRLYRTDHGDDYRLVPEVGKGGATQ